MEDGSNAVLCSLDGTKRIGVEQCWAALFLLKKTFFPRDGEGREALWSRDYAIWVWFLARDIVYFWVRQVTVTVPLSTQVCKGVPLNLMLGVAQRWTSQYTIQGAEEILLVVYTTETD